MSDEIAPLASEGQSTPHASSSSLSDVEKLRFDYAWKWFAYHAEQRMKSFNFMIIIFGILATAIVTAVDKKLFLVAEGLSLFSVIVALLFSRLDRRNRDFVWLGQDMLRHFEHHMIFIEGWSTSATTPKGIAPTTDQPATAHNLANAVSAIWLGQHRAILPLLCYLFTTLFALAFILLVSGPFSAIGRRGLARRAPLDSSAIARRCLRPAPRSSPRPTLRCRPIARDRPAPGGWRARRASRRRSVRSRRPPARRRGRAR